MLELQMLRRLFRAKELPFSLLCCELPLLLTNYIRLKYLEH